MFNPLIESFSNLTDTELDNKINDLTRKYYISRNPQVQMQISTLLNMYREEAHIRRARAMSQQKDDNNDLDSLINIS